MSNENDNRKEQPRSQKPQWAINRDVANMFGFDWGAPRPDQRGYESGSYIPRQAPSMRQMMENRGIEAILRDGKCYDLQDDGSYKAEDGEVLPNVKTAPKITNI